MKKIEIDDDVFKYILSNIEDFGESPSDILRRLLISNTDILSQNKVLAPLEDAPSQKKLPQVITEKKQKKEKVVKKKARAKSNLAPRKKTIPSTIFKSVIVPDVLSGGIDLLCQSNALKKESLIINKFKMILTALYFTDKELFVKASKITKGASRVYIGENLQALLASPNEEEVAVLIASKPRDIPYTPMWVVTHTNSARKRIILRQLMNAMNFSSERITSIVEEI